MRLDLFSKTLNTLPIMKGWIYTATLLSVLPQTTVNNVCKHAIPDLLDNWTFIFTIIRMDIYRMTRLCFCGSRPSMTKHYDKNRLGVDNLILGRGDLNIFPNKIIVSEYA